MRSYLRKTCFVGPLALLLGMTTAIVLHGYWQAAQPNKPAPPGPDAKQLWEHITSDENFFRNWRTFPGINPFTMATEEPHGARVSVYVNDIAYESLTNPSDPFAMKYGSIMVKENYPSSTGFPSLDSLSSLTVMYKVEGYDAPPADNEWFWVMYNPTPEGSPHTIDGNEGFYKADPARWEEFLNQEQVGKPSFCLDCHGNAANPGDKAFGDYVWKIRSFLPR